MVNAHFDDIRNQLLKEIELTTEKIVVAVYWFTHEELFEKLLDKLDEKLQVELIIHNDYINNRKTGLPFQSFIDKGGKFFFSNSLNPMHNKFCVIDNKVLINGSYNWTYYAEARNRENILIIKKENNTIEAFANEFERLKSLTVKVEQISSITRFEVDEFNQLSARDYLANDIIFQAKATNRPEIVDEAFQIAPDNIEVQKEAFNLDLTKKWRLKRSIGSSLKDDKYLIIVPKGTMIPVALSKITTTSEDNQQSATSNLLIGDDPKASRNLQFAEMTVKGIPPMPAGVAKLKYHFTIDIYGKLKMEKISLDSGMRQIIVKQLTGLLEEINE